MSKKKLIKIVVLGVLTSDAFSEKEKEQAAGMIVDGGNGSGNWGHMGRPGKRGGSGKGGGSAYRQYNEGTGSYQRRKLSEFQAGQKLRNTKSAAFRTKKSDPFGFVGKPKQKSTVKVDYKESDTPYETTKKIRNALNGNRDTNTYKEILKNIPEQQQIKLERKNYEEPSYMFRYEGKLYQSMNGLDDDWDQIDLDRGAQLLSKTIDDLDKEEEERKKMEQSSRRYNEQYEKKRKQEEQKKNNQLKELGIEYSSNNSGNRNRYMIQRAINNAYRDKGMKGYMLYGVFQKAFNAIPNGTQLSNQSGTGSLGEGQWSMKKISDNEYVLRLGGLWQEKQPEKLNSNDAQRWLFELVTEDDSDRYAKQGLQMWGPFSRHYSQ